METNSLKKIICSGGLFLAADTKRVLLLLRNKGKTAGTWGFVGGKKEPNDTTPVDILTREIEEEIGFTPLIKKIVPLEFFVSNDQLFYYNTYALITESEFIPILNDEHSSYAWCKIHYWPKPLHQAVKNSFNNRIIKAKLEVLVDLL